MKSAINADDDCVVSGHCLSHDEHFDETISVDRFLDDPGSLARLLSGILIAESGDLVTLKSLFPNADDV